MVQALRQIISLDDYDEASLTEALSTFACAHPDMEDSADVMRFLREDAIAMERAGLTRTYLLVNDGAWADGRLQIDGYFSLALKILNFKNNIDGEILYELFGDRDKHNCPAYLIGQLARSQSAPQGAGRQFLNTALSYIANASDLVGGRIVYLDSLPERQQYYQSQGFRFLQNKHKSRLIQMYRII